MTFEQTLEQLHGWLDRQVAVSVHPALLGAMPLQVAMFFGVLSHAEEPPEHVRAHVGRAVVDDDVIFFFVGEEKRDHFVLTRALFDSAELQATTLGEAILAITLRGVRVLVILEPNSGEPRDRP